MKENEYDILIVGGGLSGAILALLLSRHPYKIGVLEKDATARHKVCGEYISREVKPVLVSLLPELDWTQLPDIRRFSLTDSHGRRVGCDLPLGGIGISRYALEGALREKLLHTRVEWITEKADRIESDKSGYIVISRQGMKRKSRWVAGAYGKASGLDKGLGRHFTSVHSPWMGIKAHFMPERFDSAQVSLHLFKGGYAGLSSVENGRVNVCALYHREAFRKLNSTDEFFNSTLMENPDLRDFLSQSRPLFEHPLSISNVHFGAKGAVAGEIPMCGDSAGVIYPLSGNGMAMAIRASYMLAQLFEQGMEGRLNRDELLRKYQKSWYGTFRFRLWAGSIFQKGMTLPRVASAGMSVLRQAPFLLPPLVRTTHGKIGR